jgi:flagellar hook-associated protein 3
MAILPISIARVSNLLRSDSALSSIAKTQQDLLEVQNQISTGKRVNVPSDDPGAAAIIQQLQKTLEQRQGYAENLRQANSQLGEVDSRLGDLTDLLQQAQTIASANVGSDVTADQRQSAAQIVQSLYSQILDIANTQFNGAYLFAGDKSTAQPFVEQGGSVRFVGSDQVLQNQYDENTVLPFMVNGAQLFGALSAKMTGAINIAPALTPTTRVIDLRGAAGNGITLGTIRVGNGASTADINLSSADTVQDVSNAINAAKLTGVTASVGASGLQLAAAPGANISVTDIGGGTTAADLGILTAAGGAGAGVSITGQPLGTTVTPLTRLSDLRDDAGLDLSGLTITNGLSSAPTSISFAGATTVEDILNKINSSAAGVQARINAAGNGIDIIDLNQTAGMTISENGAGGATASQLGLRTLTPATSLSQLNGGQGVRTVPGPDLQITRRDGTTFSVDLDGATTIQDVINAINAADGGGGVTASFAPAGSGNGIVLADSTGGAGSLSVSSLNASPAAADLGLPATAAAGNTLAGADVNPINATGVFANLAHLRDALNANDQAGITAAAADIKSDYDRIVVTRGQTGARLQELQARTTRMDDENLATKSMLSDLQDVDFTTAITRFQQLQTQLQANYQAAAQTLHMSLLDFLG